jgi:hypothetical protein
MSKPPATERCSCPPEQDLAGPQNGQDNGELNGYF